MELLGVPLVPHLEPVTTEPLIMSRLTDALDKRFNDLDEIKDVAKYGCDGGDSGFIYYKETRDFFFEHEDEIEEWMNELYFGDNYLKEITDDDNVTINQLINKIVWIVVETYCHEKSEENEMVLSS